MPDQEQRQPELEIAFWGIHHNRIGTIIMRNGIRAGGSASRHQSPWTWANQLCDGIS